MEMGERKLTERQRRFADHYLRLGNASQAAEEAGFKRSYAQAVKRQPAVKAYINERLEEMRMKDVASADEVLSYLTAVMRGEADAIQPEKNASPRMKAAELLGKRLGIFSEVSALSKAEMPQIVDDIPQNEA